MRALWKTKRVDHYDADYVIVGSGAGGATAAYVLASAGHRVLLLEEGPRFTDKARPRPLMSNMAVAMRKAGTQATSRRHPLTVLQGRLVGGSTAINSAIVWRTPSDIRANWRKRGLAHLTGRAMDHAFDELERELGVQRTDEAVLGENSRRMRHAAEALELDGQVMSRNAPTCEGSAQCLQGCPRGARTSMDRSFIPRAEQRGARVLPLHRANWIRVRHGRAMGIEGTVVGQRSHRFIARARRGVILAAGAIHSPWLMLRRGFRGAVGRGLQSHPGTAVIGRFEEPVGMSFGATQGYEVPCRDRGYKLESLGLPPELLASRIPGAGAAWWDEVRRLDHYAQWVVQVRMNARGRVRLGMLGNPVITYRPTHSDMNKLQEAVTLLCRMMLVEGARVVHPGIARIAQSVRSLNELESLNRESWRTSDVHLLASHLFGSCGAGVDPNHSVVGPTLESHACANLYVMDGSALPTNMGVNPQHTIMAFAWAAASLLA